MKLFNRRVKGTEKFWSEGGPEAILQLRPDYLSETQPLERFWEDRQASATGRRMLSTIRMTANGYIPGRAPPANCRARRQDQGVPESLSGLTLLWGRCGRHQFHRDDVACLPGFNDRGMNRNGDRLGLSGETSGHAHGTSSSSRRNLEQVPGIPHIAPSAGSIKVLCKRISAGEDRGHEATHLRPPADRRRAAGPQGRPPLPRGLHPPTLPDPPPERRRPQAQGDRRRRRLLRPVGPQRHPRLRGRGARLPGREVLAAQGDPRHLRRRRPAAAPRPAPPQPARLRQADEPLDARPGRRGGPRRGPDRSARQRRDDPPGAAAAGRRLEAGQDLDHQPRPGVPAEKGRATG